MTTRLHTIQTLKVVFNNVNVILNWIQAKFNPSSGKNPACQIGATTSSGAPCEMRRISLQNKGKSMDGGDY